MRRKDEEKEETVAWVDNRMSGQKTSSVSSAHEMKMRRKDKEKDEKIALVNKRMSGSPNPLL